MEDKLSFNEFQELINKNLLTEGIETTTPEEPPLEEDGMPDIDFESASISPENTLKHITTLMNRVQGALRRSPNNVIFLNMAMRLLDTQCKLQGMFSMKPEVQGIIDAEVNLYKSKFILLADKFISDKDELKNLMEELTTEGL